jgi:hypothetical protein
MAASHGEAHAGSAENDPPSSRQPDQPRRRRALLYLAPVLLAPLLMIAAAFFIVPSHWLELRSDDIYMLNEGYGARLHGHLCQVLVYGDSGAMVGIDPLLIQQRTGLSVCNIAEYQGMTMVSRTLPLDQFLKQNPAPRYMLFLYSPQNLNVPWEWTAYTVNEAISYRLQHSPGWRTALLLAAHPTQTLAWAEGGLHLALTKLHAHPLLPQSSQVREPYNGQFRVVMGRPRTVCDSRPFHIPPDPKWIQHLRTAYATPATTVLVDATPTPDCDPNNPYFAEHLRGLVDDYPLPHLPLRAYTDEGVLHTDAYGAGLLSNLIANQILALEHSRSAPVSLKAPSAPAKAFGDR